MQPGYPIINADSPKMPPGACALAVMIKTPRAGAVKTRLVPPLHPEEAAALSMCFLRDVTANIAGLASGNSIHGVAAYTPVGEESAFEGMLPTGFRLLPQRGAHLGERLLNAFRDLLGVAGYETVCLINADSPTLPAAVLREAVQALQKPGDRMVLGQAEDGGYYLIGLKQPHRRLFEQISWSTEKVLSQTLERAREISLETTLLPTWYDVDDADSMRRLCGELFSGNGTSGGKESQGYSAPYTRQYLSRLLEGGGAARMGVALPSSGWLV